MLKDTVLAFFLVVAIGQIFPLYFANLEFFFKKSVFELFNNFYSIKMNKVLIRGEISKVLF